MQHCDVSIFSSFPHPLYVTHRLHRSRFRLSVSQGGGYQLISLKALSLAIGESRKILSQFYAFYGAKLRILVFYRHSVSLARWCCLIAGKESPVLYRHSVSPARWCCLIAGIESLVLYQPVLWPSGWVYLIVCWLIFLLSLMTIA